MNVCVFVSMCTLCVHRRCLDFSGPKFGMPEHFTETVDTSVTHQPFIDQSSAARGGTGEVWQRRTLGRGGGGDGWSLTHHLDAVRFSVCVYVYVRVCVCLRVSVCVWGQKKVTHWSPDVNCLGWTTESKKAGDSVFTPHSISLPCKHTHTHTHRAKPWEWWAIMEQTLTNLHLLAGGLDSESESRQSVQLISPSKTHRYALSRQRDQWPLLLHRSVSRGIHLLLSDIYTSGIHCG